MTAQLEQTPKERLAAAMAALGLTVTAEFVSFSRSRSAKADTQAPNSPNLNWRVTLHRSARPILTTDYSAGSGHCPASKASVKRLGSHGSIDRTAAIRWECEHGKESVNYTFALGGKAILPDPVDVVWSLTQDADVIDAGGFEEWAGNYGYDTDSRKAEGIYRACLEIALKLRSAIGDTGLQQLRDAGQDY